MGLEVPCSSFRFFKLVANGGCQPGRADRDGAINCVAELRRTAIVGGKFGIIHWKLGMKGRKEGSFEEGRKEGMNLNSTRYFGVLLFDLL